MTQQVIEVVVSPQGNIQIQTHGFAGPSCRQASQFLEEALGARLTEQLTSEFHQTSSSEASEHEQA